MTREEVETAAFWGCAICLECKEPVEVEVEWLCPDCGKPVLFASVVLQCLDLVEEDS